jgi:cellulose synthase (UDP-forming)
VTAKGGRIGEDYLDWTISKPYLLLLALNLAGLAAGLLRVFVWTTDEPAAVAMNMFWALFNLVMLGAAIGVAREARQVRVAHRIPLRVPATLLLPDGRTLACKTSNYSFGGLGLALPAETGLQEGDPVGVCLTRGARNYHFPARVMRAAGLQLGVLLETPDAQTELRLIECTFGRADAWIDWTEQQPTDVPLRGMKEVIEMGIQGLLRLYDAFWDAIDRVVRRPGARQP